MTIKPYVVGLNML